jgi:hypothetical protein
MKKFLIVLLVPVFFACRKDDVKIPPSKPTDRYDIRLKDVLWHSLPAPMYHFVYNDSGYITDASFSSGLRSYDLNYSNSRIRELKSTNATNQDRLVYTYEDQRVAMITYFNAQDEIYRRCFLTYNNQKQLTKMEWEQKQGNLGFHSQRTLTFTYYQNGDLHERHDHLHLIPGQQQESLNIQTFQDYDRRMNVDGFMLLHPEGEHMILLPGVKLQRHNPGRVYYSGTGVHYRVDYTYDYNSKNAPVWKRGAAEFLNGPNKGEKFNVRVDYSYY